jgi:hypothetical protein
MSSSNQDNREILTPDGTEAGEELSDLAEVDLDKLNFFYAKDVDLNLPEGDFGFKDFDDDLNNNQNLENKVAAAETFEFIPGMVDSVAVADEVNYNIGVTDSLVMANEFSNPSNGQLGTGLDNSVVVGDYNNVHEFNDGKKVDYGPFMRKAENSTWIGDVTTWPVFDRAIDNLIHGNIGQEELPVNHLFEESHRNVVIGDEVYAEQIGSQGVNLVVADKVEADKVTNGTIIMEDDEFKGDKEDLANYFFNISNESLAPFKAFNLEGSFEDWNEIDEELHSANEKWSDVREDYHKLKAAQNTLDIPDLESSNEEIYSRLKHFQTNFRNIDRHKVLDKDIIGAADLLNGEKNIYFGDGENNFRFSYDEDAKGLDQTLAAIDGSIEEELNYFQFDGGEKPVDLIDEIEGVKEKGEKVREEYEDPLALFENLDLTRFRSTEDIDERLEGFDEEIKESAKKWWKVSETAAEGLVEAEETSYIVDILPQDLYQRGKDHYLQILSDKGPLDIDIQPEELRDKGDDNSRRDNHNIQRDLHSLFESPIDPAYKTQMVDKIIEDIPEEADAQRRQIAGFTETLGNLKSETRDMLYDVLKTDKDREVVEDKVTEHESQYSNGDSKFGNTLVEIGKDREYHFFIDDEVEQIEELLETKGDLPEVDPFFEEDSPYREIVKELTSAEHLENGGESEYGELSDQELAEKLRMVRGLGERLGFEYDASNVFGMLKGKEGQRQNTDFKPDQNELESLLENRRKELEKDVNNKLRAYTKEGIKKIGFKAAAEEYKDSTGETPEELTENELAALKVRKRQSRWGGERKETIDTLLKHQNDVYELESNQEWLENHGFNSEDLVNPDLSDQVDDEYSRPENPDYASELQVEIDSSDISMDIESEKDQYWNEITELMGRIGIEEVPEDMGEVEEVVSELEDPNHEQDYQELKDAINNYHSVDNRAGGIPDHLTLRVSDPMDTTRMGQGFGSCHDIDGGSYAWASISNAVDANKMVFYAEDEKGRERARVKAFITEDEELVYHNTSMYKDIDVDTSEYFEGYMEKVSDKLDLELRHSSEAEGWKQRTELLEAHDWYSGS